MNKKFIYLNNEEVAVTDEDGNIAVRDAEGSMSKVLGIENKIEALDDTIDALKESKEEEISLINFIVKCYPVLGVINIAVLVAAPLTLGLLSGLTVAGATVLASGAACCGGAVIQNKSYKRIAGLKSEIKKANEIKEEMKKEIESYRKVNDDYSVPDYMVGNIVDVQSDLNLKRQDSRLQRAYNNGYKNKNKVKQLVLEKK